MEPGNNIPQPAFSAETEKAWLAVSLAWVAGFADAFGFLTLNNIFFSAISGNTVAANAALGRRDWTLAAHHASPILFFVIGFVAGTVLERCARRLHIRRRFSIALGLETALLLAFLLLGQSCAHTADIASQATAKFYCLIALLAGAMGVQSAGLRRVQHRSVNTPFMTGMLLQALENTLNAFFNMYDRFRDRVPEFPPDCPGRALFYGGLWSCFAIGAICGGFSEQLWKFPSLLAPMSVLGLLIVCDLVRPIHD